MIAEQYLKRRYLAGYYTGLELGRDWQHQLWADWNRRKIAAERENQPFTDPEPEFKQPPQTPGLPWNSDY